MKQHEQRVEKPNPNAPAELSRFAFLIGRWKFDAKFKLAGRRVAGVSRNVVGSLHPRRLCDRRRIQDDWLVRRTDCVRHEFSDLRLCQAGLEHQVAKRSRTEHGRTSRRSSSAEPGSTASPSPMPLRQSVGRSGPLRAQPIQIFPRRISLGAVKSLRTRKRGLNSWSWSAIAARSKRESPAPLLTRKPFLKPVLPHASSTLEWRSLSNVLKTNSLRYP